MYVSVYDEFVKIHGFGKPFPPELYHYTNTDAAINILENGEFWLTHVKYFNDRKEYHDGVELILEILGRRAKDLGEELSSELRGIFLHEQWLDKPLNVAILSFSAQRDLLSQWRGYTRFASGISLCFDTNKLFLQDIQAHLRPCVYSRDEKIAIVNKMIDLILHKFHAEKVATGAISAEAFWLFQESALSFKDEAFREEDEWRMITFPYANNDTRWNFRSGSSTIIPFVKIKLPLKACLNQVMVGPSENQELTMHSLFYLMFKHDIWRNNVVASSVPYRSL